MTDPLALLIKVAKEKHVDKKWTNQPLYLIKILPNTSKGDLGEDFIEEYAKELGFEVEDKKSNEVDLKEFILKLPFKHQFTKD